MPNKVILLNDIVGSSRLFAKYNKKYMTLLIEIFNKVTEFAKQCDGLVIKNIGDSFLISFDKMTDALKFVKKMLRYTQVNKLYLSKENNDRIKFRTGIFQGNVYKMSYKLQNKSLIDYFGNVVNTAARLEANVSPHGGFAIGASKKDIPKVMRNITKTFGDKISVEYLVFKENCKKTKNCRSTNDIKGVKNIHAITGKLVPVDKKKSKKKKKNISNSFMMNE